MSHTIASQKKDPSPWWRRLLSDQRGASTIEYVIVVGLVSLAAVTIFGTLGTSIAGRVGAVNTRVTGIRIP